jgi:hypothetical protein
MLECIPDDMCAVCRNAALLGVHQPRWAPVMRLMGGHCDCEVQSMLHPIALCCGTVIGLERVQALA